jgi:hypothetical protein
MPVLIYNNVRLDAIATVEHTVRPVMDPSGIDRECLEVTLAVEGVWSEYGHGSGKQLGQTGPNYGVKGDRLAVSLYNLRETLSAPRQTLFYVMGNTITLEAPQRNANNVRYPCDVKGGPFPEVLSVTGNVADKTAFVRFRIKTYVSNCEHYLLSNRWRLTDHVDANGFASLTIQGRASFRRDFLAAQGLHADDWRKWLIYPCEPRMRRVDVQVVVSADGCECDYYVLDREVNYGTGATSLISRVDCHVTSGNDYPIKTVQQAAAAGVQAAGQIGGIISAATARDATGAAAGLLGLIGTVAGSGLATSFVSGVCQVTGQPGADRYYLARVAHSVVHDRCRTWDVNQKVTPVTTRLSVDWSSEAPPWVEFMAAYRVPVLRVLETMYRNNETRLLNWDPKITGSPALALNWDQDTPRAQLGGGENTRAENVGRLITQVLSQVGCEVPGLTAQPGDVARGRTTEAQNTRGINTDSSGGS